MNGMFEEKVLKVGQQPPQGGGLVLPFKPFSLSEVFAITNCPTEVLDAWIGKGRVIGSSNDARMGKEVGIISLKPGEAVCGGGWGLDLMQTFAVFVGTRYLREGSDGFRAAAVVRHLQAMSIEFLNGELTAGRCFSAAGNKVPTFTLIPLPFSPLAKRLDLRVLMREFEDRLAQVFPKIVVG